MGESALEVALAPLHLLSLPTARTWWPALLGAMVIAALWELLTSRPAEGRVRRALLVDQITHPSSRVDVQLLFVRAAIRVLLVAALPLTARFVAVETLAFAYRLQGQPGLVLEGTLLVVVYSLALFLVSDFSRYLVHRLMHAVPLLWRFHQVHHSAEVLTPLTLYRIHPVEQAIQTVRGILVVGVVAGIFGWLSFGKATVWTLYGVPGVMIIFNVLGANLRHSSVWLPYPSLVERFLISPAQHQIHHDADEERQRRNYGSALAVWDSLAGSLELSREGRPERLGIAEADRNHDPRSVLSTLVGPFRG